jgi:diguanylate cyclase (GGDEF)-like protein
MGHRHGDAVLARIGQIIKSEIRDVDIPCRYGGEELAVILPQTDLEDAMLIGERVRARVERELQGEGAVTVSGGAACCPEHAASPDGLVEAADRALYAAKRAGKNRVLAVETGRSRALGSPI